MHRMKCEFDTNHNQETHLTYPKKNLHPERLSDNGTLDTFLHRVRLEILDEYKHKQNKSDHLTRQERQAINNNPTLIVNKADKGSTIVDQDWSEYIDEVMKHLSDPNTQRKYNAQTKNPNFPETRRHAQKWFPHHTMVSIL